MVSDDEDEDEALSGPIPDSVDDIFPPPPPPFASLEPGPAPSNGGDDCWAIRSCDFSRRMGSNSSGIWCGLLGPFSMWCPVMSAEEEGSTFP